MKNWYSTGALVLLAVLFLALTMLTGVLFKGARLDLTENRLYTLSPGTINLIESIEEPITLDFYFSEDASADFPMVRNFARRVQELLEEMAAASDGQLLINRIDPAPFSEEEDDAARYGLEGVPTGVGGDSLYLGIVGTNLLDGLEVMPFVAPSREAFLEYDLARMIYSLSQPDLPKVGLISGLPISGGFDMQTRQPREPWAIYTQITEQFDIENIEPTASELLEDIDVLVLIHPKDVSEALMAEIDAFVQDGGRLLAFVDPYAETDPGSNPADPMAGLSAERDSGLDALFEAWGVEYDRSQFVADRGLALQVALQQGRPPVYHPGILGVTRDFMDSDDVVTGELETINLASVGYFRLSEDSPLSLQPLILSSPQSGPLDSERLRFLADPSELMAEVAPGDESLIIAARLSGPAPSAFAEDGEDGGNEINVLLVADADLLADRYWVQRQRFFGQTLLNPFANNGDFVINAIDNLIGNADLISVRSRATSNRPFQLVEGLRREAEDSLRATEQRLEAELAETEERLTELQQARGDTDLSVLTPEQEAEIDRFVEQRLDIRRQLRQVRRDLDRDIEALGTRIKVINIALMPVLITFFALWMAWRRRREQTAKRGEA
ncbi:GldG family protein [Wenzhouxiangella marina]|uniref:ABC transporter auxiliary component n=1 Tax=Wenzhouxiangella marina TaxID=1579979 RepID=A0A0K0XWX4_9GAMM|nr:Gldg family protein [Wenzhouxiangella marina]AKS42121.1 ABC transporter auxiliary component [Wenzhouxiangella marina]MBB6086107.1 ABC-type uncharacterized transport system involved in gliding motility auxiliary subunit [Wenzhouxiangella marina]